MADLRRSVCIGSFVLVLEAESCAEAEQVLRFWFSGDLSTNYHTKVWHEDVFGKCSELACLLLDCICGLWCTALCALALHWLALLLCSQQRCRVLMECIIVS